MLERHVQTIMLSVITAALIACFTFLWNMNAKIAVMEERDNQRTQSVITLQNNMTQLQNTMSQLQTDITTVKIAVRQDQENSRR